MSAVTLMRFPRTTTIVPRRKFDMNVDTIYNENCLDTMGRMPDGFVDLTVTSPPYDGLREYNGYSFPFEDIARELFRITKPGGVVVWVVNDGTEGGSETGTSFRQALFFKEIGFNIHDTMIWKKESCAFPESTRYYPNFEYMFVFSKGAPKTTNLIADRKNLWGGTKVHGTFREKDGSLHGRSTTWKEVVCKDYGVRFNVWEISTEKQNRTGHPAVFPIQLAGDHIRSWSNEGDLVYDCFLGSGTTALAAHKCNRHYLGSEISEEYFKIAQERIKIETANLKLF